MSSQRIRFVEARTARTIAIIGLIALLIAALAFGIAIGTVFARSHLGEEQALAWRCSYEIKQLGHINGALSEITPRVETLSAQVGELRDFDFRLKGAGGTGAAPGVHDVPPLPDGQEPAQSLDGSGGPELTPRLCDDQRMREGTPHQRLKSTEQAIECLDDKLSALQSTTLAHYTAYMAFPGRDPVPGARFGSPYGNRYDPFTGRLSFHPGMDLAAVTGTPILASAGASSPARKTATATAWMSGTRTAS